MRKRTHLAVNLIASAMLWSTHCSGQMSAPATQPSPAALSAADAGLLAQLEARDWRDRQAAERALLRRADRGDLGQFEKKIQSMFTDATMPESRIRLSEVLDHIVEDRLRLPTLITMHMTDVPARQVYQELFRQMGLPQYVRRLQSIEFGTTQLTVNVDHQPYWEVLQPLIEKTDIGLFDGPDRAPCLMRRGDLGTAPKATSGPFLFVPREFNEEADTSGNKNQAGQAYAMMIHVFGEPRRNVLDNDPFIKVLEAVDDRGNSLLTDEYHPELRAEPGVFAAVLKHPKNNAGTRIVSLKGVAYLTVANETRRLELSDILFNRPGPFPMGGTTAVIGGCKNLGDPEKRNRGALYRVRLKFAHPAPIDMNYIFADASTVRLLDASGRELEPCGIDVSSDSNAYLLNLHFDSPTIDGKWPGSAWKFIMDATVSTCRLEVPFEFNDVDIQALPHNAAGDADSGNLSPADDIEQQ